MDCGVAAAAVEGEDCWEGGHCLWRLKVVGVVDWMKLGLGG